MATDPLSRLVVRLARLFAKAELQVIDDTGQVQLAQAHIAAAGDGAVEETIDQVPRIADYGFASCPPVGAQALLLFFAGLRSRGCIIATDHRASRPRGLQPGEAVMWNGVTHTSLKLDAAGDLVADCTVRAPHVIPADGVSGSFTSQDGKHITVTDGVITGIA